MPFSLDGEGRVLASWMSRGQVYWSISDAGATRFGPRVPVPGGCEDGNFPTVLTNRSGEVLLVWKEGSRVNWASYDRSGRFTGERGTAGDSPGQDKPMAFVDSDERFRILF